MPARPKETLELALEDFRAKLHRRLTALAEGTSDTPDDIAGIFSMSTADAVKDGRRIRIFANTLNAEGNAANPATTTIELRVPDTYKEHEADFVKAAEEILRECKFEQRNAENTKQKQLKVAEKTHDSRLAQFITELRERINDIPTQDNPARDRRTETAPPFNGTYSANTHPAGVNGQRLRLTIIPLINGKERETQDIDIGIPFPDRERTEDYLQAVQNLLEQQYALAPRQRIPTPYQIQQRVAGFIRQAEVEYPAEFSLAGIQNVEKRGTFTTSLLQPTDAAAATESDIEVDAQKSRKGGGKKVTAVVVNLRPIHHFEMRDTDYNPTPVTYYLTTNTQDDTIAKQIEQKTKAALTARGFHEYDLRHSPPGNNDHTKQIPKESIVFPLTLTKTARSVYQIVLMPATPLKRLPSITWGTGTRDEALAERKRKIIEKELLPRYMKEGENEREPLTLQKITDFMNVRDPEKDEVIPDPARRSIREVTANGQYILTLFTPVVEPATAGYTAKLTFGLKNATQFARMHDVQLNTQNKDEAHLRANVLQGITQQVLTDHFSNPHNQDLEIVTEQANAAGAMRFTNPTPGQVPGTGKVFLRTLIDNVVASALVEYNRYIVWDTSIHAEEDGRYRIHASVLRNLGGEQVAHQAGSLRGPHDFYAATENEARQFADQLNQEIAKAQYLFSRERPVEQFGIKSIRVAIRNSLINALNNVPGITYSDSDLQSALTGDRNIENIR